VATSCLNVATETFSWSWFVVGIATLIPHFSQLWRQQRFCCSSVARGGAMGHLHPPKLSGYVLDKNLFWLLIHKKLKFEGLFVQKCSTAYAPPNQISGYTTVLLPQKWRK
jgi:hypothetical protein